MSPKDDPGRASLRARLAIVTRELTSLRAEKTIILALAIQLVIAGFSSFLVVGLVSLYDPSSVDEHGEIELAVTGEDTDQLLAVANNQDGVSAQSYDRNDAYDRFENGQVAAVLDGSTDQDDRLIVRVTAPDDGLQTTLLITQLRDTLTEVEHIERQQNADRLENVPLDLPNEPGTNPYFGFTYTILLPLLLFLPVFISGSIAVDSLIEERQRGTLSLLRVSPLSLTDIIGGKLFTAVVLAPLQAAAWLMLLVLNGTMIASPTALLIFVTALSLLIVGLGLGVALYAPDRRQAQLLYSVGIVAILVVSSVLPEHPANTAAKFAIGSETTLTWALLATYCVAGIVAVVALRVGVGRLDPDSL